MLMRFTFDRAGLEDLRHRMREVFGSRADLGLIAEDTSEGLLLRPADTDPTDPDRHQQALTSIRAGWAQAPALSPGDIRSAIDEGRM